MVMKSLGFELDKRVTKTLRSYADKIRTKREKKSLWKEKCSELKIAFSFEKLVYFCVINHL